MKKIIYLIAICLLLTIPSNVLAKNKVNIYFFRGNTCPHCEEALDFIYKNKNLIPEDVEIITYEVWKDKDNAKLRDKVADKLNVPEDDKYSVPLIVIGNQFQVGIFPTESDFNGVFEIAQGFIDSDDYTDLVADTAKELKKEDKDIKFKSYTLDKLYSTSRVGSIVAISIFGVLVLAFVGLIVFSRKK